MSSACPSKQEGAAVATSSEDGERVRRCFNCGETVRAYCAWDLM
jgi:hypothetical protein